MGRASDHSWVPRESWLGQWGLADPMCLSEESSVVKACPSSRTPIMLGTLRGPGLSLPVLDLKIWSLKAVCQLSLCSQFT